MSVLELPLEGTSSSDDVPLLIANVVFLNVSIDFVIRGGGGDFLLVFDICSRHYSRRVMGGKEQEAGASFGSRSAPL